MTAKRPFLGTRRSRPGVDDGTGMGRTEPEDHRRCIRCGLFYPATRYAPCPRGCPPSRRRN